MNDYEPEVRDYLLKMEPCFVTAIEEYVKTDRLGELMDDYRNSEDYLEAAHEDFASWLGDQEEDEEDEDD